MISQNESSMFWEHTIQATILIGEKPYVDNKLEWKTPLEYENFC